MNFGHADYQQSVNTSDPVAGEVKEQLRYGSFPDSIPPDFTDGDYQGFKTFPAGDRVVVSYYANEGATDESNRPILSSRFVLFSTEEFGDINHDVVTVAEYLRTHRSDLSADGFRTHLTDADCVARKDVFQQRARQFNPQFLADATSHLLSQGEAAILYKDWSRATRFLQVALSLTPTDFFTKQTVTSSCDDPKVATEDVLLLHASRHKTDSGGGLFGRIRSDEGEQIDINSQESPVGEQAGTLYRVVKELRNGPSWYDIGWQEKHRILRQYVATKQAGRERSLDEVSDKLRAMQETIKRVDSIESSGRFFD